MCEKGYAYDALENKCTECSGEILYSLLGFLGIVLVLVLVGAAVARKYPKLFEMVTKDAARGTVEQDEDEEDEDEEDASHKRFRLAKSKFKIVLGVYRTVSRKVYSLGLPSARAKETSSCLYPRRAPTEQLRTSTRAPRVITRRFETYLSRTGTRSKTRCPESCLRFGSPRPSRR